VRPIHLRSLFLVQSFGAAKLVLVKSYLACRAFFASKRLAPLTLGQWPGRSVWLRADLVSSEWRRVRALLVHGESSVGVPDKTRCHGTRCCFRRGKRVEASIGGCWTRRRLFGRSTASALEDAARKDKVTPTMPCPYDRDAQLAAGG